MNSTFVKLADNHLSISIAPPKVLHLANHGLKIYNFKRYEYVPLRNDVLWCIFDRAEIKKVGNAIKS